MGRRMPLIEVGALDERQGPQLGRSTFMFVARLPSGPASKDA